jgi:hypothetical protein
MHILLQLIWGNQMKKKKKKKKKWNCPQVGNESCASSTMHPWEQKNTCSRARKMGALWNQDAFRLIRNMEKSYIDPLEF